MRSVFVVATFLSCTLLSLAAPQSQPLRELVWMAGLWKSNMGKSPSFEQWTKINDSLFTARSFVVKGTDTTILEHVRLAAMDSGIFYIAHPRQNPAPTWFRLIQKDSAGWVFENPQHDFPTRVIYRQITPDSMHARIEGLRKGQPAKVDFVFERVK